MTLLDRFIEFNKKENLFHPNDSLLLAVSGGVDSVVLCELCRQAGYKFVIAHCNFRLRNKESERDKEFVFTLAKNVGVEFLLKEFNTNEYASENRLSTQEAARILRYEWFNEIITHSIPQGPRWILTAHHADDNIETMLMNFFRGTGIHGLRGMLPKQGRIIRPLLMIKKNQILEFANIHNLNWVEDSSNQSDKYSRNYFRYNVIPLIQTIYLEVEHNLLSNLHRFSEIELLYNQSVDLFKQKLIEKKGNEIHIPVLKLKKALVPVTIIHEIIKEYGFSVAQVHDVLKIMDSETGKYIESATHRIIKNRNWIIIAPGNSQQAENIIINESDSIIEFDKGKLVFERGQSSKLNIKTTQEIAQVDSAEICFPLLLRKSKTGDYFYPLGMRKKKKLSRFFIDQKLSKSDKENVWILEMNKKIVWIIGMRIDDRFKISQSSTSVLSITLKGK